MHVETSELEPVTFENDRPGTVAAEAREAEWITPDFVEQSACAEICAYVFTA
jgi:hypothetical protein